MTRVFKPLHISVPNAYFCSNTLHHPCDLRVVPTSLSHAFNSRFIPGQQAANSSSIFNRIYYYFHVTGHRFTFSTTTALVKLTSDFYFPTFLLIWIWLSFQHKHLTLSLHAVLNKWIIPCMLWFLSTHAKSNLPSWTVQYVRDQNSWTHWMSM